MGKSVNKGRDKKKLAYRARHRLLSIDRDSKDLKQRILAALSAVKDKEDEHTLDLDNNSWPWLPNKQCGSWYLPPTTEDGSATNQTEVYFKSTDGHVGTYAISLKRLNLPLLEVLHEFGGCFLVDSSVRKRLPDSFSRTIPIWCCVINRLVLKYRKDLGLDEIGDNDDWDIELHTPASIVSPQEHTEISNLIDSRVELLYQSKAIVDLQSLVRDMTKPVRAIWVANGILQNDTIPSSNSCQFSTIVCCNPSYYGEGSSPKNHIHWVDLNTGHKVNEEDGSSMNNAYYYTPGAADDDAGWGRRLTHTLFWANKDRLLQPSLTEDETDDMIDSIVNKRQKLQDTCTADEKKATATIDEGKMDKIGEMNLWVGSRRAGKPPECWESFDAILNVTENEYPNMELSIKDQQDQYKKACYYLQCNVQEGKKDKTELERWMPVGLAFLMEHLQQNRKVLVHCAQGRDRSVGIVVAFLALFCPPTFPLRLRAEFDSINVSSIAACKSGKESDSLNIQSGLSRSLVDTLLQDNGRDTFLKSMHQQLNSRMDKPFANKDSLRIVLHLVRQDRENAEPTRSTMQKLNRFFMTSPLYRSLKK